MLFRGRLARHGPEILGRVRLSGRAIEHEVAFFVDTGSTETMLSERDAVLLGADVSSLPAAERPGVSLGGFVSESLITNIVIKLRSESGMTIDFPVPEAKVQRLPSGPPALVSELDMIPSILGHDFFSRFGIRLEIHYGKRAVLLETGSQ